MKSTNLSLISGRVVYVQLTSLSENVCGMTLGLSVLNIINGFGLSETFDSSTPLWTFSTEKYFSVNVIVASLTSGTEIAFCDSCFAKKCPRNFLVLFKVIDLIFSVREIFDSIKTGTDPTAVEATSLSGRLHLGAFIVPSTALEMPIFTLECTPSCELLSDG